MTYRNPNKDLRRSLKYRMKIRRIRQSVHYSYIQEMGMGYMIDGLNVYRKVDPVRGVSEQKVRVLNFDALELECRFQIEGLSDDQ